MIIGSGIRIDIFRCYDDLAYVIVFLFVKHFYTESDIAKMKEVWI